jgi:hypothetical protein
MAGLIHAGGMHGMEDTTVADLWVPAVAVLLLVMALVGRAIYARWSKGQLRLRNERLASVTLKAPPASIGT